MKRNREGKRAAAWAPHAFIAAHLAQQRAWKVLLVSVHRFPRAEICARLWGSGLSICYTVFIIQAPVPRRCAVPCYNAESRDADSQFLRTLAKCWNNSNCCRKFVKDVSSPPCRVSAVYLFIGISPFFYNDLFENEKSL